MERLQERRRPSPSPDSWGPEEKPTPASTDSSLTWNSSASRDDDYAFNSFSKTSYSLLFINIRTYILLNQIEWLGLKLSCIDRVNWNHIVNFNKQTCWLVVAHSLFWYLQRLVALECSSLSSALPERHLPCVLLICSAPEVELLADWKISSSTCERYSCLWICCQLLRLSLLAALAPTHLQPKRMILLKVSQNQSYVPQG